MFASKKWASLFALLVVASLILSACATPTAEVIEKVVEKVVTQVVKEVVKETVVQIETVKETVIVEGTPEVIEREVTKVVEVEKEIEVVVTATPEPVTVQTGGTIIGSTFADAEILNPILSVDTSSGAVNAMMFNSLTQNNPEDGSTMADLAESWDVSEDGLTVTFYLRQDVTWHDGEPFTAADVKFTWDTILNEEVNSPRRSDIADLLTPEQIVVLDDYTIQMQLSQLDVTFLAEKTYYGIIPQHILGEMTAEELNAAEFNTQSPIGTGPFMFREWVKDDHVALVKNPNYFEGEPNTDFWYYKIVENQTVQYAQLQTGEIDYAGVTAALWEDANQQENLVCKAYPTYGFNFYVYQLDPEKTPLFLDVRTRQALYYALDRQAIVDSIAQGLGEVAHSVVPALSWASNPDNAPKYGYEPEKAKELLDEAGWKDEDGDGVREAHGVMGVEDGTPFVFEIHTNAGNVERESLIVTMQQYWNEIGVGAETAFIEWNALLAELTETYEYDMIMVGFSWGSADPDQKTMWHTDSYGAGFNMNKYSNPDLDVLIDKGLVTVDKEERTQVYYEIQRILAEEVPAPILYFRNTTTCWNKRLHERDPNANNTTWNAHEWWVER
jgi:peptide/nickel transport system substrate-binding protein